MEPKSTKLGLNRTGVATSPIQSEEMRRYAEQRPASSPGSELGIARERAERARESQGLGSVPPPHKLKGLAKAALDTLKGKRPTVFIDKLGERLAFERVGVRLYEAALSKLDVYGSWEGGPTREALQRIADQELEHMGLCKQALEDLGADPTVETPAADLTALVSMGVPDALTDPRINLRQCLEALLVAELTDNASWELLIELTDKLGHGELATRFQRALDEEADHLAYVRSWLAAGLSLEAQLGEEAAGAPA